MGEVTTALTAYTEAASLAKKAKNLEFEARAWLGQAKCENRDGGDSRIAESKATKALTLVESSASLSSLEADVLMQLSLIEQGRGNFDSGLEYLVRATQIASSGGTGQTDPVQEFQLSLFRSFIMNDRFATCRAEHVRMPYFTGAARAAAQDVESRCSEELSLLVSSCQKTMEIAKKTGYSGLIQQAQAEIEMVKPVQRSWEDYLRTREQLVQNYEQNRHQLDAWNLLHPVVGSDVTRASFFPLLMVPQQRAQYQGQLAAVLHAPLPEAPYAAYSQAVFLDAMGEFDAAVKAYLQIIRRSEARRSAMTDSQMRGALTDKYGDLYKRTAMMLSDQGRLDEAFDLLERRQAKVTTDFVASNMAASLSLEERSSISRLTLLQAKLNAARSVRTKPDPANQRRAWSAFDTQLEETQRKFPDLLRAGQRDPVPLKKLQEIQRAGGADGSFDLVTYLVYSDRILILHIGPHGSHAYPVLVFGQVLSAMVEHLEESIHPSDASAKQAEHVASRELYLMLLQPIAKWLETKHLVVVRPPEFAGIQFESLQDPADGKYAIEKLRFSYAPSATIAASLSPVRNLGGATGFAGAAPDLENKGSAGEEIRAVLAYYPGSETVNGGFPTRSQLMTDGARHSLVSLAVHGAFDDIEPMLSSIQLKSEQGNDGRLTAAEMTGLPLRNKKLVIFSACSTGRVGISQGTEQYGIVRALLFAGAQAILLAAWDVDSQATALYMTTFLREAVKRPLPEAAQLAALAVKAKYPDPYYWAAFSLMGR